MQIYDILKQEHEELKGYLNELVAAESKEPSAELVEKIRGALIPHSRAEEAVFYNTLREFHDAKPKVMHSFREHLEAETLLRTLQMKEKIAGDWKATATKLKTAVEHHIAEEEDAIFKIARGHLTDAEAEQIGTAFQKLKQEKLDDGIMKSSLDLVANLMPTRFTERFRGFRREEKAA
jgi:hypothetical protein